MKSIPSAYETFSGTGFAERPATLSVEHKRFCYRIIHLGVVLSRIHIHGILTINKIDAIVQEIGH